MDMLYRQLKFNLFVPYDTSPNKLTKPETTKIFLLFIVPKGLSIYNSLSLNLSSYFHSHCHYFRPFIFILLTQDTRPLSFTQVLLFSKSTSSTITVKYLIAMKTVDRSNYKLFSIITYLFFHY